MEKSEIITPGSAQVLIFKKTPVESLSLRTSNLDTEHSAPELH